MVRVAAASLTVAALAVVVAGPLTGLVPVVRLSAVLVPVLLVWLLALQPFRWRDADLSALDRWTPSARVVAIAAAFAGALLFWIVLTRFESGEINAVDFTVYFDRPLLQTTLGRPLFVETTDDPRFDFRTHLAVHGYWLLIPLSALYLLAASPIWLLALAVIAPLAGAVHVLRIARHLGFGGALASATAFAYLFNDNTARALNYGFHPELMYCWFVPWLLDAALHRARRSFVAAALLCMLVKEDAIFPLLAASITLALIDGRVLATRDRVLFLVAPPVLALISLVAYYWYVVPSIAPGGMVMYAYFWENHGSTPLHALTAMVSRPLALLRGAVKSGLLPIVLPAHLFLPLIGWRWSIGTLPVVIVYGASASEQVRDFGIYYSIVLVPFYAMAASQAAATVASRTRTCTALKPALALMLVLGGLLVGNGFSLRPWKAQIGAVPSAIQALDAERVILVQSGLYPHAGYDPRVQLLTPHALADPANAGAAIVLARGISSYPFDRAEWNGLFKLPAIATLPEGVVTVRLVRP